MRSISDLFIFRPLTIVYVTHPHLTLIGSPYSETRELSCNRLAIEIEFWLAAVLIALIRYRIRSSTLASCRKSQSLTDVGLRLF